MAGAHPCFRGATLHHGGCARAHRACNAAWKACSERLDLEGTWSAGLRPAGHATISVAFGVLYNIVMARPPSAASTAPTAAPIVA